MIQGTRDAIKGAKPTRHFSSILTYSASYILSSLARKKQRRAPLNMQQAAGEIIPEETPTASTTSDLSMCRAMKCSYASTMTLDVESF